MMNKLHFMCIRVYQCPSVAKNYSPYSIVMIGKIPTLA
jgi:hypothetical protein